MRFTTFYFSGTGNTEWAVRQFNQLANAAGHDAVMFSIENIDIQDVALLTDLVHKSDYIGFANPIYGGNIPPIMRIFIEKLTRVLGDEDIGSVQTYFINTCAYINGFGPVCARKLFRNTAFNLVSYVNIQICNNISRPGLKTARISADILDGRKEKAKRELSVMVGKLVSGKRYITGVGPYLIPNIFIRMKTNKLIAENYKELSVEDKICTKCLQCVRSCPTNSIKYEENKLKFTPGCTACMRCYNFCTNYAILFDGKYADPNEYQRYHGPETVN